MRCNRWGTVQARVIPPVLCEAVAPSLVVQSGSHSFVRRDAAIFKIVIQSAGINVAFQRQPVAQSLVDFDP